MNTTVLIILAIVNIPLYLLLGKWIFKDWRGFAECLRFWLTPNIISLFRGEYAQDWWSEMKLFFYLLCCGVCVAAEYALIAKLFL